MSSPTTVADAPSTSAAPDSVSTSSGPTTAPTTAPASSSTSLAPGPTIPQIDPNAEVCAASAELTALGAFSTPDDAAAIESYFTSQAARWSDLAAVAPSGIAIEAATVADYSEQLRALLEANEWDLFAVAADATALESSTGADVARIVVDQFLDAACSIEPPTPERATAVFYTGLLVSAEDRTLLAEILASAEVFSLDGAMCFVERVTPDAIHPLVGAPATPAQEGALDAVLSACQLTIGT